MAIQTLDVLFDRVLAARKKSEIQIILKELGDRTSMGLGEKFGPLNCEWVAYGESESNEASIGLSTNAGRSLTERITNGIDALLESAHAESRNGTPRTPSDAAELWFGRDPSGPQSGLYSGEDKEGNLSRSLSVVLADSGVSEAPTVDVIDRGIGLSPEMMPGTILSLQEGNKVKKPYLMGTFGQGGSSTLAFCDYAVVISRCKNSPGRAGFTIIRLVDPGEDYALEVYSYLKINEKIPHVDRGNEQLEPYTGTGLKHPPILNNGTLVRHVGFKLSGLSKSFQASPGNLYHYLHLSMFDPLLPFRVIDIRGDSVKDERVGGSRNRLMKLTEKGVEDEVSKAGSSVVYHHEMEDIIPLNSRDSRIGVEYWVVRGIRKVKDKLIPRSSSNDLFVQRNSPIIASRNGQNQGELSAKFLRDIGFRMLSRHMVVHLDISRVDRRVRRELFSSTRESFKEGPQLDDLKTTLSRILKEDSRLAEIEQDLTDKMVNRDHHSTSKSVKKQITRLLQDAGYSPSTAGESENPGGENEGGHGRDDGGEDSVKPPGPPGPRTLPLPTKPYPDVTEWEIVSPAEIARVRLNGRAAVRIETDADDRFENEGLISIEFEPQKIEVAGVSNLRSGRKQWRLRAAEEARIGDTGTVTAVLRSPNGGELRSAINFEIFPAVEDSKKGKRGNVPDFDVIPINPDEDPETWVELWPQHEDTPHSKRTEVAYKVFVAGPKTIVYYSTLFGPYVDRLERMKSKSKAFAELFEENYQVWIGYHAILQWPEDQQAEEMQTTMLEDERCRVATVQVRVAEVMAGLQRKAAQADEDAGE
ncbi:MAG: hypothetical protein DHS20C16_14590 [Phycisphaerae bacterium]|nr:MAG: hypothetical protein DHS20C16_14590 [Phycisphaerae bacterium]